jgi:hypothetical protein
MNIPDPRQYHFVIMFDEQTGSWDLDIDTLNAKFNNELIFDINTQTWRDVEEDPEGYLIYLQKEAALAEILDNANGN